MALDDSDGLFSGSVSIQEALRLLRLRLLDLTARNRLLNFKHTAGKSLQFIDASVDGIYKRLVETQNGRVSIGPIPEPDRHEWAVANGRYTKPEPRDYAGRIGIEPSYELERGQGNAAGVKAIYYPEDLAKHCRKIHREARLAIEETGANMLFLVFGFLEFPETQDSTKTYLAPLISVPVAISEADADRNRIKSFVLLHTGEELAENLSLREKLKRDFGFDLPVFDEESASPETYLHVVHQAIARRPNWKIRYQLTLALLSFSNMLLVRDLDPAKWPMERGVSKLVGHSIVRQVFEGSSSSEASYGEEYSVDEHPRADLPLIYDCDSSQHSALIDAVGGKNLVIEGPPGTGKSQTITNLIAAAIQEGKKVLFVSEKLAALQVVKSRLEQVGLGDFVLELHSNKTNKKRVLDDLSARIRARYRASPHLPALLRWLEEKKSALKAYAELLNSVVGNEQGLTVHQVMWRAERYRLRCGDQWSIVQEINFEAATHVSVTEFELMRDLLSHIADQFIAVKCFDMYHPFWGFFPESFMPNDDLTLQKILFEYALRFDDFAKSLNDMAALLGEERMRMSSDSARDLISSLSELTLLSQEEVAYDALPYMFTVNDLNGDAAEKSLRGFEKYVENVQSLEELTRGRLIAQHVASFEQGEKARKISAQLVTMSHGRMTAGELDEVANDLSKYLGAAQTALVAITEIARAIGMNFDGTERQLVQIETVLGAAVTAPRQFFFLRHAELFHPQACVCLSEAHIALNKILAKRAVLSESFYLDVLPSENDLTVAILTLRDGQTWYRIFQGSWRRAVSLHRRLDKTKAKKTSVRRLEELDVLVAHQKSTVSWASNLDVKRYLGSHYRGEDSPLTEIVQLAEWCQQTRNKFVEYAVPASVLDIAAVSEEQIVNLLTLGKRFEAAKSDLQGLTGLLQRQFGMSKEFSAEELMKKDWPEKISIAGALSDFLARISEFVAGHSPSSVFCVDSLTAVDASSRMPGAVAMVNEHTETKALLGTRFAGMNTLLEPVNAALTYGRRVKKQRLRADIEHALVSDAAMVNHRSLMRLAQEIESGWKEVERFSMEMQKLGEFDLGKWVGESDNHSSYAEQLFARTKTAASNLDLLLPWAQYVAARKRGYERGLQEFVCSVECKQLAPEQLANVFGYRFYSSIAHALFRRLPQLGQFAGNTHSSIRAEFAKLDKEIIEGRGVQVAASAAARANPPRGTAGARVDDRSEMVLLNQLMAQIRPRMPIRKILSRAGRSVQELKPCFMMGPQAVAQFLEPDSLYFDMVIMDEASQLRPEEAIGAIARGRQLVVVGDPKQLPPTTFFSRMGLAATDEEGQQFAALDSESILDVCMGHFQPVRTLRWHYRSQHESLIAFSNHEFYQGNLVIFPSPFPKSKALGLRYRYLSEGVYENQMNRPEAVRVVDAVVDHILTRPNDSLGVATLNIKQRDLIAELIDERFRNLPQADDYRQRWENYGLGLFIKNLENVQGDERDVIFISTTFGKAPGTNVVRQNFGPISRDGGWRRLNVLFTRARRSVTVFTSMHPEDIIVDGGAPRGTVALRNYLEFARNGVLPRREETGLPPDSDFEVAVADVLRSRGYEVTPQLGVAGFRIDIAVRHPIYRSAYLAAIECDGATYHSAISVRDRDRIRQEILESLGWKGRIWRIWSTDWFRNPTQETARMLAFLDDLSKQPISSEYVTEDQPDKEAITATPEPDSEIRAAAPLISSDVEDEDFEIQVGDLVTYRPVADKDAGEVTVKITLRKTDPAMGFIAEVTPLAQALLGAVVGDEVVLRVPGKEPQRFLIKAIRRSLEEVAV